MAELVAVPALLAADQAEPRYIEALQTAVAACAEDTEGQTCYICTEAVKEETNEGLVSGFCACRGGLSFAHVSCLARQAQVEVERDAQRWKRWHTCRQCEQEYHGVVKHALGWACWKTYVDRPEADEARLDAMTLLGCGLSVAGRDEDALVVGDAQLSMSRRVGVSEASMLITQSNLAITYKLLGRNEDALQMQRDVYSGRLRLYGEEHEMTLNAANNYAATLKELKRFEEAKALWRKVIPVARRVLGESDWLTLKIRVTYGWALYNNDDATTADLREAVNTLEEIEGIVQRVYGGTHPFTKTVEGSLRKARAALRARETPQARSIRLHMRLLDHASACRDANCPSANCGKMKNLLRHGATCTTRVQGGCAICRRMWALLQIHARECTRGSCPVPKCASLKAQLAQMQQQGAS